MSGIEAAYQLHGGLYQHYSTLLFRSRVAILTLSAVLVGIAEGIWITQFEVSRPVLKAVSALLVALLCLLELAYFRKFNDIMLVMRDIEPRVLSRKPDEPATECETYFSTYLPFKHIFVYVTYFVAAIALAVPPKWGSGLHIAVAGVFYIVLLTLLAIGVYHLHAVARIWHERYGPIRGTMARGRLLEKCASECLLGPWRAAMVFFVLATLSVVFAYAIDISAQAPSPQPACEIADDPSPPPGP